jgi:diguanylate cyclase (GGDEF)-like protein
MTTDRIAPPAPLRTTSVAIFFIVLVCLSLVVVDSWRSYAARELQLHETRTTIINMAHALAQHADDTIKGADTALVGLVDRLQSGGTDIPAMQHLFPLLVTHVTELPQLHGLFVADASGAILMGSGLSPHAYSVADRDYFIYHRDHADHGAYVGAPLRGRASGADIFTVSRRLNDAGGGFAGVVVASINIAYFERFYDSFDIGKHGLIILGLNSGVTLARRPLLDSSVGKDLRQVPIFRDHVTREQAGVVTTASTVDGVERINSFQHLKQYPVFVAAALSKQEVLAGWRDDMMLHSLGVATLGLLLVLLGGKLIGQIRLRIAAEHELLSARDALDTMNRTLQRLALEDELTGLANRRQFELILSGEFTRAMRNAASLALIMIDVDFFKHYNDLYGHPAGDDCLRRIGQVLLSFGNRSGDLYARYGGEELAVLLPGADVAGAIQVAEKIRLAVRALNMAHAGNPPGMVTISLGVAAFAPVRAGDFSKTLVQSADNALYAAKKQGRDRTCSQADPAVPADRS